MEFQKTQSCACCAYNYELADIYCNTCGYPLQGSAEEQDAFIANRTVKEIDLEDLNRKVKSASTSLYWIGGILGVSFIFEFFRAEDQDKFATLIIATILVGAFMALAVWSKSKPLTALISGLSLYVIIIILTVIIDPINIVSGIIFKIIIIGYLIKGIMAVLEVEKIKKELNIN